MNKNLKIFIFLMVAISLPACGLSGFENALAMAKAITPDPNAVYVGEFQTTYPDSHPGAGVIYESSADSSSLVAYYKAELDQQGWKITEVHKFDDYSQTVVITASKGGSVCYLTIANMTSSRKITIKVE